MNGKILQIPTEIARFKLGGLLNDRTIEWRNPFNSDSIFELKDSDGNLIYKMFLQNGIYEIPGFEDFIDKSYTVEIKNIESGKIKMYSIAY